MTRKDPTAEDRTHSRAPIPLEVKYRTSGSFLVSYSLNLSRGGIFLPCDNPPAIGQKIDVNFSIPSRIGSRATREIHCEAEIAWRKEASENSQASQAGMGLIFRGLDDQVGDLIDSLVRDFQGVHLSAVANDEASAGRLARYLTSALSCRVSLLAAKDIIAKGHITVAKSKIVPARSSSPDNMMAKDALPELLLIDIDECGRRGIGVVDIAHRQDIPVVAFAAERINIDLAKRHRVEAIVNGSTAFDKLRTQILDILSRPEAIE